MFESRAMAAVLPIAPGGRLISYLPSAHVGDRALSHFGASICYGQTLMSLPDLRQVAAALEAANASLSRVEQVKRFAVLDAEWPPGRRRADAHDEAQAQADPRQVRRGHRATVFLRRVGRMRRRAGPPVRRCRPARAAG
jgi:long-subunit acyl-CoA synthetase (AMP-forming)